MKIRFSSFPDVQGNLLITVLDLPDFPNIATTSIFYAQWCGILILNLFRVEQP